MRIGKKQKFYPGKMKNILVTGGAGFIGSHLCDKLVKENNVICLDNFVGGGDIDKIKHLLQNPNFRFIKHDINKPIDFKNFPELKNFRIKIHGIQEIYHLACPTSAKNFNELRIQTLQTNSTGILNILEMTRFYNAKMLFTSSSVIYGPRNKEKQSFKEDDLGAVNLTSPRACYDEGKRFAEAAIVTYKDVYQIDVKIARVFRTYGPRESLFDGQMVPDFVLQAIYNKPLIVYGNEQFATSLCEVSDMVNGLMALMDSEESGPINLGHPQKHKLIDLAQKIVQITGSQSKVEYRPALPFMTALGLPDISLARQKLEWFPIVQLDDGLRKLVDYVKANRIILQPLINKYDQE